MTDTTVDSDNNVEQWSDDEFYEYVRRNPLKGLMGQGENSIIQVKEELTKEAGDAITFSLVTRLTGTGVTGDNTLEGNEENLGNYGQRVTIDQLRHGVVVGSFEKIKTKIDLLNAARIMLRVWNMEQLRDLFIARFISPVTDGVTTYQAATEAQKDAWQSANNPASDNNRIVFGAALANESGDHSTDLANVDSTADDAHQDIIRLLKRQAQRCDPHIRPVVEMNGDSAGKEQFVALMGSLAFRDLESNFESVQQQAGPRGASNQIFASGDIKIGNVICKEIPEMDRTPANGGALLEDVGNGGNTDVEPIVFCGAQALMLAWGQRMQAKMDEFDYQNRRGVAVSEIRGCAKSTQNSFQHGVVTGYVSAVGD